MSDVGWIAGESGLGLGVERRTALKFLGASAFSFIFFGRKSAPPASASALALRKVIPSDATHLETIMNACVRDTSAFHGKCDPWSLSWAQGLVTRCPDTLVITLDDVPVAFHEIPPIRSAPAALSAAATSEQVRKQGLRERNRRTMRISAVGVRADTLGLTEAVHMFRRVLYYGAKAGGALGYEYAEACTPWEQHPRMTRKWTDYPGCEVVYRTLNQSTGSSFYWLRWRLADFANAFEMEGADDARLVLA